MPRSLRGLLSTARRSAMFVCFASAVLATQAQAADVPPALRVVRMGYGDVPAMKAGIVRDADACRIAKKLPQASTQLPGDAVLAKLAVVEQEELFDGRKWALYETQRQVGADGSNGCQLALFASRHATTERTCVSRSSGSTELLAVLMDFDKSGAGSVTLDDTALPAGPCRKPQRPVDAQGLPTQDAAGTPCIWSSAILNRQMAAILAAHGKPAVPSTSGPGAGFDTCVYALRPEYVVDGFSRPVVLISHSDRRADGSDIADAIGETAAPGNLQLASFTTSASIADARFGRPAIEQFLHRPTKTSLGDGS